MMSGGSFGGSLSGGLSFSSGGSMFNFNFN